MQNCPGHKLKECLSLYISSVGHTFKTCYMRFYANQTSHFSLNVVMFPILIAVVSAPITDHYERNNGNFYSTKLPLSLSLWIFFCWHIFIMFAVVCLPFTNLDMSLSIAENIHSDFMWNIWSKLFSIYTGKAAELLKWYDCRWWWSDGRQRGRVVRASDLKSVGRGFKSRSDH